jgi:hypothetical protein
MEHGSGEEVGWKTKERNFEQSLNFFDRKVCSIIGVLVRRTLLSHVRGVCALAKRPLLLFRSLELMCMPADVSMMELSCGR